MTQKCIDAFKNINIVASSADGIKISPCCLSPTVSVDNIDFENDQYLNQTRESWTNNQYPLACVNCKNTELAGYPSRRHKVNQWYKENNLDNENVEMIKIDYWVGDLCNLACVICGPKYSSVWKQELKLPILTQKVKINQLWTTLNLNKLRYVHFNGGEPLLNKEHVRFLQAIPNKNSVQINYNTNGTVRASDELLSLWKQFKLVQLDFSIDDIGDRFEYQRYPAKWSEVSENLLWYIDNATHNCMFAVNTSVGILNHSNLNNLNSWLQQNFIATRFTDAIEHRQQPTQGIFAFNGFERKKSNIVATLDSIDQRRGTNWRKTFPELIKLLSL